MTDRTDEGNTQTKSSGTRGGLGLRARVVAVAALLLLTVAGGLVASSGGPAKRLVDPGDSTLGYRSGDAGPVHFTGNLDRGSVLRGSDGALRMELVLTADEVPRMALARVPTDVVVVLDRSGSMGGKPLADAISSVQELVARLGNEDRFALVTYASDARLAIPMQAATPLHRTRWSAQVAGVRAGGGTNMAAGVDLATQTVGGLRRDGRTARVILLSDGHANQGDHSLEGLRARAARVAKDEYVLSTVGVGLDFDEALMTVLADAGTGNFYYVREGSDLGDVFAGEFDSARETVASAVAVEIELAPGVELKDAAGYPIEREGRVARFRPGSLFSGQSRHVWLTFTSPTTTPGEVPLGDFRVTYREPGVRSGDAHLVRFDRTPHVACVEAEAEYVASLDPETVVRAINQDGLATLKRQVARAVSSGRFDDARQEIKDYRKKNEVMYRSLGIVQSNAESFGAAADLDLKVEEAAQAPSPAVRKALSKTLDAEGQDLRRIGAKHQ